MKIKHIGASPLTGTMNDTSKMWDNRRDQLDNYRLVSFGIPLETRHGIAEEMAQMLMFSNELYVRGLNKRVSGVFYDSNSSLCVINVNAAEYSYIEQIIRHCAKKTISQFELHGYIDGRYEKLPPAPGHIADISKMVPVGWRLVPVKPTRDMREAFHQAHEEFESGDNWRLDSPDHQWAAMLAAAPDLDGGEA